MQPTPSFSPESPSPRAIQAVAFRQGELLGTLRRRATEATLIFFPRSACPTKKEVFRAQSPPSLPSRSLVNICRGHCSPLGRSPGAPCVPPQPRRTTGVASAVPRRPERRGLLLPDSAQQGAGILASRARTPRLSLVLGSPACARGSPELSLRSARSAAPAGPSAL